MSETKTGAGDPVIIKKYANRRLYNTQTSSYVTLDHLLEMVKEGVDFEVRDARTGDDITRSVLTQIIFDEEGKGQHLLPIRFLRQLIRFYGDNMQAFVPRYLEFSMDSFSRSQKEWREKLAQALGESVGFKSVESLAKRNMAIFENAMRMFSPFGASGRDTEGDPSAETQGTRTKGNGGHGANEDAGPAARDEEIRELKDRIEAMQRQLAELAQRK